MPQPWPVPNNFDGAKFARRYNLTKREYFIFEDRLYLQTGTTIPDDPPILEQTDPPELNRRKDTKRILTNTTTGQLARALAAVTLQEINIVRAALVPPLPPRTLQQLKTAIENKIDDGTAD